MRRSEYKLWLALSLALFLIGVIETDIALGLASVGILIFSTLTRQLALRYPDMFLKDGDW